jgi:hypothetical protein
VICLASKKELLSKLRIAKEARGLSYQDIVDITEQNGEAISLATVKRLFQKNSNIEGFRYGKTIRPIARAVLGMDEELEAPDETPTQEKVEEYVATIEGLKVLADLKHERVLELEKEVEYFKGLVSDYKIEIKWCRRVSMLLLTITVLALVALVTVSLFQ